MLVLFLSFFTFMMVLLKFLTTVLLVAHNGFQIAVFQIQRVVPYQFVVLNLLEG